MRTPEEIEALLDRIEPIIGEYDTAKDNFDRSEWSKKFGNRLGKYSDKLKKLNGDDFDIMNESYDEYHKDYSDLSDDDYCNALEDNIKKVLQRIWPDAAPEQIEQAVDEVKESVEGDGEAEIEVETKPETEVKVDGEELTSDEEAKEDSKEDIKEDNPYESFKKELESYKGK